MTPPSQDIPCLCANDKISSSSESQLKVYSLKKLKIEISADVYETLSSQYQYEEEEGDKNIHRAKGKGKGKEHLNRLLKFMKYPSSVTTCRVNTLLNTMEEVQKEIEKELSVWKSLFWVEPHFLLQDVLCIRSRTSHNDSGDIDGNSTSLHHDYPAMGWSSLSIPPCEEQGSIFQNWPNRERSGWPMTHRVVICDIFCGEAVLRGSNIFVKGILVADAGIQKGDIVAVYADLHRTKHAVARGLLLKHYMGECVFLGLGTAKCNRANMFSLSHGLGIEMFVRVNPNNGNNNNNDLIYTRVGPPLPPLNGILTGKMMLQNLPSTLVPHILDLQPQQFILDMCAAPGGKTAHIASLVSNNSLVVACDKSRKKVIDMRHMLWCNMGASCVLPVVMDTTKCVLREDNNNHDNVKSTFETVRDILSSTHHPQQHDVLATNTTTTTTTTTKFPLNPLLSFQPHSFDRILLDPPCSALGLRPKLSIPLRNRKELRRFAIYQKKFVHNAIALLKPQGIMTYSTCTITYEENEGMVKFILDTYPNMKLRPVGYNLGRHGLGTNTECSHKQNSETGLSDSQRGMVRRFDPGFCEEEDDDTDTMGFFVAKFQKVS